MTDRSGFTIALLPGLDGTGDLFAPFVAAAPADVKCIAFRYPCDEALGYDELEEFVAARLPREERLVLVGESFSGPIAVRLAERFSDRVALLVLCNSFVTPPWPSFLRHVARTAVFRMPLPERILASLMFAPFATPALTSALIGAIRQVEPFVLAHRVRQLLTVDEVATLRRIEVPVVYLRGTHDRLVSSKAVAQVVAAAPQMRMCEIEAPHALLQTAPAEAWAATLPLPPWKPRP